MSESEKIRDSILEDYVKNLKPKVMIVINNINEIDNVHNRHAILSETIRILLENVDLCRFEAIGAVENAKLVYFIEREEQLSEK